jgi:hypothetical protein
MLITIHDNYYRDSPESIQLSAFIAEREPCRLSGTVAFKASHAPEQAGDRSRPPQNVILTGGGDLLEKFLRTDVNDSVMTHRDDLTKIIEEEFIIQSSSKRWSTLALEVLCYTRQSLELSITLPDSKEVMTIYLPLGVFTDMRKAMTGIRGKRGHTGLVLSWTCPTYAYSLPVTAQTLD